MRVGIEVAELAKKLGFKGASPYYYLIGYKRWKREPDLRKFPCGDSDNPNMFQNVVLGSTQPHLASAPTQAELQTWLRERGVDVYVEPYTIRNEDNHKMIGGGQKEGVTRLYECVVSQEATTYSGYHTWEEALEIGLEAGLKTYLAVIAKEVMDEMGDPPYYKDSNVPDSNL